MSYTKSEFVEFVQQTVNQDDISEKRLLGNLDSLGKESFEDKFELYMYTMICRKPTYQQQTYNILKQDSEVKLSEEQIERLQNHRYISDNLRY
jgi:hypothetical protein